MKKFVLTLTTLLVFNFAFAQNNFWTHSSSAAEGQQTFGSRTAPSTYKIFTLDLAGFRKGLKTAVMRGEQSIPSSLVMSFPTPDGKFEQYRIIEASVLHPELTAKYRGIKSYAGQGIDDPSATIRFSISSQKGFHGMVLTGRKGANYIDPFLNDKKTYVVYSRKDISNDASDFECFTEQNMDLPSSNDRSFTNQRTNDKKLRKYRLALSCTAEYGNIFAGSGTDAQKKANILAQMNVTMTRVNGIYERDLAITMEIVANNDAIIYFGNTKQDPWKNEWNSKTQEVIDAAIGDANYDIGHNFNAKGGGNAGCIGCVCTSGKKGRGIQGDQIQRAMLLMLTMLLMRWVISLVAITQ